MVWSNKVGDGNNEVCVEEEHVQHIYRRRGQQPMEGCGQPLPLFLFMVVVTPSFVER
jgi:hypothetical protein